MKKFILAFALLASTVGVAQAQDLYTAEGKKVQPTKSNWYGGIEYETAEDRKTKADSYTTGVILGYKDGPWQYSAKVSSGQAEWGSGSITNRYEGRVKHTWSVMNVKPYLGVRLGETVKSTTNFSYYAIDTGVAVPVTDKFDVDFSYRYRNAFDTVNNFETNRYGIEGKVKLTDKDSLGLRYAQSYGDSESNSWRLQYTRSF